MIRIVDRLGQTADLRKRAEAFDLESESASPKSLEEARQALRESRVQQIELEMQNKELRRTEAALISSEAHFLNFYDLAPVAFFTVNEKGLILEANLTAGVFLGIARDSLVMKPFTRFVFREDQDLYYLHRMKLFGTGESQMHELRMLKEDGTLFWANLRASSAQGADGMPVCRIVLSDIVERKKAEAEREAMAKTIERKNKELENLIYVTSHDLRSPLMNIQGFSERLKQACADLQRATEIPVWDEALRRDVSEIGSEQIPKALGYIQTSVEKMKRLIEGLLRMAHLGLMDIQPERLDLNRLIRQVCGALAYQIQEAGAQVVVDQLPPCESDATLINQLFTNLLENAVKYRDRSRPLRVHITGRCENGRSVYSVADNGSGIPTSHIDKIWILFHRVDPTGPVMGEGLGLSLVRRIVERHHGDIHVESVLGEGTRFIFTLPVACASIGRCT